jgi:alpha-beta hydrolase superfamily lysophospholipase
VLWGDPRAHGIDFNEYYVRSFDGTRLLFWDVKSQDPNPENLVLMYHGNAQNMSSHIFNILWLCKNKTDIVTFDYRGYGLSEGTPYPRGIVEDGLKALQVAYDKYKAGKYKRFIVYTQSLGGMVALRALEEFQFKNDIRLLVLDSTFKNAQEVARNKVGPLGFIISGEFSPEKNLSMVTMPALVIHSKIDPVVNYKFGEEIFNLIPTKNKKFWGIENGFHGDIFFVDNGKYRQEFLDLIK